MKNNELIENIENSLQKEIIKSERDCEKIQSPIFTGIFNIYSSISLLFSFSFLAFSAQASYKIIAEYKEPPFIPGTV